MQPEDVVKQLVGEGKGGWDQDDTLSFTIYGPSKYPLANNANVDFEHGTVTLYGEDNEVQQKFRIIATLEPL